MHGNGKIFGKVFVSGATGFIGVRLVEALVDRGCEVRALARCPNPEPPPGFEGANGGPLNHERVELVRGDITDLDSLRRAIEGCSSVFHLAAYAKNWARDKQTYFDLNVQGVRNVFAASREHDVERIVMASTIMTLGFTPRGVVADETSVPGDGQLPTDYARTKYRAEQEAQAAGGEGLPVVIVNPTRVFGPGHLTEGNALSMLIADYDRGKAPVLLNGGRNVGNYVFVEDVVQGLILAMEKGRVGERYIIGGENLSLREFFAIIDQVSGKRHFRLRVPSPFALAFAAFLKKRAEWFDVYPQITPGWVKTFSHDGAFSCEKARRELGYQPTPVIDGVRKTYQWLKRIENESVK